MKKFVKRTLFLSTSALLIFAMFTGCGSKEVEDTPTESVVEEIEVEVDTPETQESEEVSKVEDENSLSEKENALAEKIVGLTFREVKEQGIALTGYMGLNGEYVISGGREEDLSLYEFVSEGASSILKEIELGSDWETEIDDCVVDKVDVTLLDPNQLSNLIGKTVGEAIALGYEQNGYLGYDNLLITDGLVTIMITLDETCEEIYNNNQEVDGDDFYKIFSDCVIENAEYF